MQSQPTTEQILNDLAREVAENIIPSVSEPTLQVNLEMMEQLLRACAIRSAHEIAWMQEEAIQIETLADKMLEKKEHPTISQALEKYRFEKSNNLDLHDQVENYHLAGQLFEAIIVVVADLDNSKLTDSVSALIRLRVEHEGELIKNFYFPGRS